MFCDVAQSSVGFSAQCFVLSHLFYSLSVNCSHTGNVHFPGLTACQTAAKLFVTWISRESKRNL